ncbi:nicotinate-nucleotide--dimethylbenzimidazole phosphoribosyltransferase [Desulfoluna limicola]|uniref:Nicotinate-nucleotide--dimethylbenzimidazole phosphoribosyltransferase n=1 Tax=Desulfoluna limicola TaxID=2810562 RepID=A0ABM7PP53_9BACT|nr:nicotinate-nucleotide--dimethylbenzimidazole phosphoribosyltransferase [Desulfoluna limicola]BCS99298.1 nicotinate-nucleotide--dimethylbenzimidazole phosphoribosyltransferase [Desulfoluna limicola]
MKLLEKTIGSIVGIDREVEKAALARLADQARPQGSLGVLEPLSARLAAIAGAIDVKLDKKVVVTCAGDHGVVEEGVSLFPQEVTQQMVHNFVIKGASINVLAKHAGAESMAADIGVKGECDPSLPIFHKKVAKGTDNFTKGPAMSREQAVKAIEAGIEIVDELVAQGKLDMLGTGDMGIGNTTPSTAIIAVLSGEKVEDLTGRGTGINDEALQRKVAAIKKGIEVNKPDPKDPIDVLSKVGGYEIGALAGLVLGAAAHGIPVVCDGFISTAGALIAGDLAPTAKEYLFASHRSVEVGHTFMHDHLGVEPLLDLGFRLGEGTGAALTMELLDASTRILADILTFEEVAIKDPHTKG